MFHTEDAAVYFPRIPSGHQLLCSMSVQTVGQEWQCPGAGSQRVLSGCQRERQGAVSQVVLPVDRPAAEGRGGGAVSRFVSYCQPNLVFPEQICQLVWHVLCLHLFPARILTRQQVISL